MKLSSCGIVTSAITARSATRSTTTILGLLVSVSNIRPTPVEQSTAIQELSWGRTYRMVPSTPQGRIGKQVAGILSWLNKIRTT